MYENDKEKLLKAKEELNKKIEEARKNIDFKAEAYMRGYTEDENIENTKPTTKDNPSRKTTKLKIFTAGFLVGCGLTLMGAGFAGKDITDWKTDKAIEQAQEMDRITLHKIKIMANNGEGINSFNNRVSVCFDTRLYADLSSTNGVLYSDRAYEFNNVKLNLTDTGVYKSLMYIHDTTDSEELREYLTTIFNDDFTITEKGNLCWDPVISEVNKICIKESLPLYRMNGNGELTSDGRDVPELDLGDNIISLNLGKNYVPQNTGPIEGTKLK